MLGTPFARRLLGTVLLVAGATIGVASGQPAKPLTATECRRLFAEASRATAAARVRARNTCTKNDECTIRTAWAPDGGAPLQTFSVPKRSEAHFEEADQKFRAWREAGCMAIAPVPIPTQKPYWASCSNGRCAAEGAPPP